MPGIVQSLGRFVRKLYISVVRRVIFSVPAVRSVVFPLLKRPEGRLGRLLANHFLAYANDVSMDRVVEAASLRPGHRVLELGFANGTMLEKILDAGVRPPVFGLEVVPDMIDLARKRLGNKAVLGLRDIQDPILGDITTLPARDFFDATDCVRAGLTDEHEVGVFDAILFTNVYYFFTDRGMKIAVSNMYNLLRHGGVVVTCHLPEKFAQGLNTNAEFQGNPVAERYLDALRGSGFQVERPVLLSDGSGVSVGIKV